MSSHDDMVAHVKAIQQAILNLQKFGIETGSSTPSHHGFLGSHTNASMSLLAMCIERSGVAQARFPEPLPAGQWLALIIMVHRAYLVNLITAVEAICDGYCKTHGQMVVPSKNAGHKNGCVFGWPLKIFSQKVTPNNVEKPPEFMDYVNAALKVSRLQNNRCAFWRKFFDGLRIIRNKSSHFDTRLTTHEKTALQNAGLGDHIAPDGTVQMPWAEYSKLALGVLDFTQELEK